MWQNPQETANRFDFEFWPWLLTLNIFLMFSSLTLKYGKYGKIKNRNNLYLVYILRSENYSDFINNPIFPNVLF